MEMEMEMVTKEITEYISKHHLFLNVHILQYQN